MRFILAVLIIRWKKFLGFSILLQLFEEGILNVPARVSLSPKFPTPSNYLFQEAPCFSSNIGKRRRSFLKSSPWDATSISTISSRSHREFWVIRPGIDNIFNQSRRQHRQNCWRMHACMHARRDQWRSRGVPSCMSRSSATYLDGSPAVPLLFLFHLLFM